eukprot:UN34645
MKDLSLDLAGTIQTLSLIDADTRAINQRFFHSDYGVNVTVIDGSFDIIVETSLDMMKVAQVTPNALITDALGCGFWMVNM